MKYRVFNKLIGQSYFANDLNKMFDSFTPKVVIMTSIEKTGTYEDQVWRIDLVPDEQK